MLNFKEQYLNGVVKADAIDDFIDEWHKGGSGLKIYEYLGFTWEEYAAWLENPDFLNKMIKFSKRVNYEK